MFIKSIVSAALFAAYAAAQSATAVATGSTATATLAFNSVPTAVVAGNSYTITWSGGDASEPVTIILREGNPDDLSTIETLTTTATGGSFTWAVDPSIADASDYAFEIVQGSENNYSGQFPVSGGTGTLSVSASGSATASTAASTGSASATAASASASASGSSAAASSTLSTAAASTTSASATQSAPSSGANGLQSPIALVLCAVAAMFYLA